MHVPTPHDGTRGENLDLPAGESRLFALLSTDAMFAEESSTHRTEHDLLL